MGSALVLAIGNPLRRDDGAAAAAVAGLAEGGALDVAVHHQLAPELADAVAAASAVAIVDAREGGPPGAIEVRALRADAGAPALGHLLSPEALLALAAALHGARPPAWLVTVAGADFSVGEGLSPPVQRALPELRRRVAALCGIHSP